MVWGFRMVHFFGEVNVREVVFQTCNSAFEIKDKSSKLKVRTLKTRLF